MTTGKPAQLTLNADRYLISADGEDLSFIRATVTDEKGLAVPVATNSITFSVDGPGKIVATDNGDPADLLAFASKERTAYSGMALVIVRSEKGRAGDIKIIASSPGLKPSSVIIKNQPVLVH